jgi:hypothetical protein
MTGILFSRMYSFAEPFFASSGGVQFATAIFVDWESVGQQGCDCIAIRQSFHSGRSNVNKHAIRNGLYT